LLDLLKILSVFALIVSLLKLKWNLGAVMLIGAAALGALMGMGPVRILEITYRASIDKSTVSLIIALALIMVLENVLRKTETLKKLVDSLQGLLGDHRVVMALMPAIIGILPSAGGAYFSAPLVEESSGGCFIHPERKSFINYWFRHIWEYISPLYPGFILMAAIAKVPMGRIFLYQAAFPAAVLVTGALYAFRGVEPAPPPAGDKSRREYLGLLLVSFSPILAVMVLVMVLGVDIAVAMVIVVALVFLYFRFSPARIWETLKDSLSFKTLLLVLGVMVFKGMMEGSGAVDGLPGFFRSAGVPVAVILFVLPFLVGLVTGITIAFVGVTFPMLLPLVGGASPDLAMLAFAFASGFAGVMYSPVHLCLVLTKDYFKSELTPIYRIMFVPELLVVLVALLQMWVL
jgi:integral membrane protein (TIGR00529 family)